MTRLNMTTREWHELIKPVISHASGDKELPELDVVRLELQAEIDYRIWLLNEMRREVQAEGGRLTPLARMIDEATGHDEKRLAEAREIIAEIEALKAAWDTLNGGSGD